ncbi:DUF2059 domain-containing protein [Rhizobium sp. SSA_523]|uniref:DUF2059 domain-containing protein n=1 Tax=Rhizobium sp. SSA_523 TaxID=2952477 RepID=UPI0020912573|nr:DUF2059 domain-containing protein [Rhizobium sp. SSA_523]MCO5730009.1 DUF2059 domain-containing protein [Rhizobium sp. SSA_523]WKC25082.1 DUF2059 domain-containing protein [Rhizobium sp. SSA_523]
MIRQAVFGRAAALAILLSGMGFGASAGAQDITPEHLKAARDVISSLNATARYDDILPNLAERLKNEYTLASPNYVDQINKAVDEQALALAPRRADLEKEVASIFARSFTEEELKQIAAFYGSEVGKKYLQSLPLLQRESVRAAEIWANGVSRDLTNSSSEKLRSVMDAVTVQPPVAQVGQGEAPAAKP